jgi:hypothetical protein
MDFYFLCFVIFSFILIAIILFILFFMDDLREIKGHFKRSQYIIYILGSLFILVSFSLSYFLYLYGSIWLAISVFIAFNGTATYFLHRASTMVKERDWKE